ncbi:hypothetical protein [Phytohabitans suffuscus]|uniref:Uncharacterized protein n=1 Tax=Phytohabitans suffuscus TaxID=624315 RepID=A0A6F8YZZ5_9ACTN|nr:hypothetical protein [Phytohabitans suffuscus]BCB91508.1 hypothetical protein Psuf_088210 [Phytohabitans suffuscus]
MLVDVHIPCPRCRAEISAAAPYCRTCGHAQPGHEAEVAAARAAAEPSARGALLPTRPAPAALISLVAVALAIVVLTAPVLVVRSVFFGPGDTVHDYFGALADRDADAAWRYVYAEDLERAAHPALASLASPDYTPPDGFRLERLDTDGDRATAQVAYQVSGVAYQGDLALRRLGGPGHTFQRWDITNALHELPVAAAGLTTVTVAGAPVYASEGGRILVFPGAYTVRAPQTPLTEVEPVTVRTGTGDAASLVPRLRVQAQQAAETQIRGYLDGCASQKVAAPPDCPFRYQGFYETTSVQWRVVQYPRMGYQLTEEGLAYARAETFGVVECTARTTSAFEPTDVERYEFDVRGQISSNGTNVVFTVEP